MLRSLSSFSAPESAAAVPISRSAVFRSFSFRLFLVSRFFFLRGFSCRFFYPCTSSIKVKKIVPGGKWRQDSVRFGLEATEGKYDLVLIHDGVRPLIKKRLIERVIKEAMTNRAVITALPAKETVKEVNELRDVVKTYDRERVWMVQTPQAFRYQDILKAHQKALEEGWEEATDDALLVEKSGITVKVVEGSEKNIKVTTPDDLELARLLLRS